MFYKCNIDNDFKKLAKNQNEKHVVRKPRHPSFHTACRKERKSEVGIL